MSRENFGSKIGAILAAAGSAVGLGNVWRFPIETGENGGVSSARNAGLNVAKGEYIGFIDPDDYIVSEMYECMVNAIEKYKSDMVVCGYDYIDENGNVTRPYKVKGDEKLTQKQFVPTWLILPSTGER